MAIRKTKGSANKINIGAEVIIIMIVIVMLTALTTSLLMNIGRYVHDDGYTEGYEAAVKEYSKISDYEIK